jgi:hypothetical protein
MVDVLDGIANERNHFDAGLLLNSPLSISQPISALLIAPVGLD